MISKKNIVSFIAYLLAGVAWASDFDSRLDDGVMQAGIENLAEGQPPQKAHRTEKLSQTQQLALYFLQLLRASGKPEYKTYLHKFIYFANGLHYALYNKPLLENFRFEAHQYGPVVPHVLQSSEIYLIRQDDVSNVLNDKVRALCEYTFCAFADYGAVQLSDLTHEAETPWSQTRQNTTRYSEMYIPPEMEHKYFTSSPIISRHFIQPFLRTPTAFRNVESIAVKLMEGDLSKSLSALDVARRNKQTEEVRKLTEHIRSLYCNNALSSSSLPLILGNWQENRFVSSQQKRIEGVLSSILFTEGFIRTGQLDLFYDPYFRTRAAISAGLNDLSAIHYLQQIFETFLNNSGDDADQKAQEVQSRLEALANIIINIDVSTSNDWQDSYDQSLAHFYLANYDSAITWMEEALKHVELPARYRYDLLQRAFYIKRDKKYIDLALESRFWDFDILKATTEKQKEEVFLCFENAIMNCDLPEAYFKAGRMILRRNYTVPLTSPLWRKMLISHSKDNAQVELGKALIEHSIKEGISEALTYYVESYLQDNDIQAKLAACNLAKGTPFANYQKGKLLESQHKLQEAREAYLAAGELLGYQDAARLSTLEKQEDLINKRNTFKKNMLESLYEDYTHFIEE